MRGKEYNEFKKRIIPLNLGKICMQSHLINLKYLHNIGENGLCTFLIDEIFSSIVLIFNNDNESSIKLIDNLVNYFFLQQDKPLVKIQDFILSSSNLILRNYKWHPKQMEILEL
jgi:hypothetical protein